MKRLWTNFIASPLEFYLFGAPLPFGNIRMGHWAGKKIELRIRDSVEFGERGMAFFYWGPFLTS